MNESIYDLSHDDYIHILETMTVFRNLSVSKQKELKNVPAGLRREKLHLLSEAESRMIEVQENYATMLRRNPDAMRKRIKSKLLKASEAQQQAREDGKIEDQLNNLN